jgi:hypothetical protein
MCTSSHPGARFLCGQIASVAAFCRNLEQAVSGDFTTLVIRTYFAITETPVI